MSIVCSFIFFYAQKRLVLEEIGELELKKSILEDDLDTDEEEDEEEEEEEEEGEDRPPVKHRSHREGLPRKLFS